MFGDQILCGVVLVGYDVLVFLIMWLLEIEGSISGMVVVFGVGFVNVDIIDVNGVKVNMLSVEVKVSGEVMFEWDGKDVNGNCMLFGSYIFVVIFIDSVGVKIKVNIYVEVFVESVMVGFDGLYFNFKGLGMVLIDYVFCIS